MNGKFGKSKVRMEVLWILDLWIWSPTFGLPGALYDVNIHEVSPRFARDLSGTFLAMSPIYEIDGKLYDWFYYLADEIFPPRKIFVK